MAQPDATEGGPAHTETVEAGEGAALVHGFTLTVLEGPGAGAGFSSTGERCSIGSHSLNELVTNDPTVSRFHCEIQVESGVATVIDLNSRNHTILDGVTVRDAQLRSGSLLRLGNTTIRFDLGGKTNRLAVSERTAFGSLVGRSVAMRQTFAWLERAASTDITVLLEGETGTGKGAAAASIHRHSARKDGPFVVIDCGAIPANLLESELFGHERGAFTGAALRRVGAIEEAEGGTIFLDEVGELPFELQPKLLRVLDSRELRRVGSNQQRSVNVRIIAATNRDLRAEVNAGRFRPDLYFRLAVAKITMPPLRKRPDDLPLLVTSILDQLGATAEQRASVPSGLGRGAWPGNVRELRNHIEWALLFPEETGDAEAPADSAEAPPAAPGVPFVDARRAAIAAFERRYVADLLAAHRGRTVAAAATAGINRVYLYKLMKKYGIDK